MITNTSRLFGFFLLSVFCLPAFAQTLPMLESVVTFDNVGSDDSGQGIAAADNTIYLTGFTVVSGVPYGYLRVYPSTLASNDPDWSLVWPESSLSGGYDYLSDVAVSTDGIYLGGSGRTIASDGVGDFEGKILLVKYLHDGPIGPAIAGADWNRSDNIFSYTGGESLSAVITLTSGLDTIVYGTGTLETFGFLSNGAIVAGYAEDGSRVYLEDNFFNSKNDPAKTSGGSDLISLGGKLYVVGHTHPNARIDGGNLVNRRAALWELDPALDPATTDPTLLSEISSSSFHAVAANASQLFAAGHSLVSEQKDVLVAKYGTDGTILWQMTWGDAAADDIAHGIVSVDDRVYLVGVTSGANRYGGNDLFLLELHAGTGDVISETFWGTTLNDIGFDIASVGQYIYVAGEYETTSEGKNAVILKYAVDDSENDSPIAFGPQSVITTAADGASSVYAADLDGDGDLDVLSASWYDHKIAWYENTDGAGSFGPQHVITTDADSARSVYAADLDGDGDLDLLSASSLDDKIAWYENLSAGIGPCNDHSGALDLSVSYVAVGAGGSVSVAIGAAPNAVAAFGFEVAFDATRLSYDGFAPGALTEGFDFLEVSNPAAGIVRVGGFEAGSDRIADGASGILVEIQFTVDPAEPIGSEIPLSLLGLVDDLLPFSMSNGCVITGCAHDGDVTQDGVITPRDALLAYEFYLQLIELDNCEQNQADVDSPVNPGSDITPGDAQCILQRYLSMPSCLD